MNSLSGPTLVDIPPKVEESSGTTTNEKAAETLSSTAAAVSPASTPPTLGGSASKPLAWEGLNWSRSSSKAEHVLNRSRTMSSMSETSMSSYSETSRSSVDLHEDLNAKEIIIPTIALLPNMVTEVAHNTLNNVPAAVNNPFQRRPTESSTSQSWFRFLVGPNDASGRSTATGNHNSNNNMPRQTRGHQAAITARSRRSLLFLFLIALYTTFGLTVHNLPVAPELEFAGVNMIYSTPTTVSADFLSEQAEAVPKAEEVTTTTTTTESSTTSGQTKKYGIKNQIAFARRAKQKLFVRPKEVKDFYQQQALAEEVDYSFFINCGILALVVCWAWRERRSMSFTFSSSAPDIHDEPNMLV